MNRYNREEIKRQKWNEFISNYIVAGPDEHREPDKTDQDEPPKWFDLLIIPICLLAIYIPLYWYFLR
jgi:hypothetical protein